MKRIVVSILCIMLLVMPCRAEALEVSATAAILLDTGSGEVLFEKNADRRMLIASTTKIMTVLVALDCADLDEEVTVKDSHMVEGSSMYLKPGEKVRMETLLYGLMLSSGNDAALVVADYCGGGVEHFVERMNEKAAELGMEDTSFANPNGLDDEAHYSTARDMARLAAYAAENATFVRLCSTKSVSIGGRSMTNHNKLLNMVDGCIGMKTGYTKAAGRTLVSAAVRDGRCLVAVTLQDGNDWADHMALYDYGFAQAAEVAQTKETAQKPLLPDVREHLQSFCALAREKQEESP